jgi:pimeloyl-ACP methyl ester carboxylesterase
MNEIAFQRAGSGPALVLLHGFLSDSRVWRTQLEELSDQFDVVAWDAPGAGASVDPSHEFTIEDWARSLCSFLDAQGVEQAHILGLSWGGILAQELYRLDPERVLSLILAGTYAGWKGSIGEEASSQRLARCIRDSELPPDELARGWIPELFTERAPSALREQMTAVVRDFHPVGFRMMARSSAETDTTELLPRISVPTLLVWGEQDTRSPLAIAAQFQAAIPHAELIVIPNAGHVANMERPKQFNEAVRGFVLTIPTP